MFLSPSTPNDPHPPTAGNPSPGAGNGRHPQNREFATLFADSRDYDLRTAPRGSSVGQNTQAVFVSGYEAALRVLAKPNLYSVEPGVVRTLLARPESSHCAFAKMLSNWMLFREGSAHAELRGAAAPLMFPAEARSVLVPHVQAIANRVVGELATSKSTIVDLIPTFAVRVPLLFITRFLGADEDKASWLRERSQIITRGLNGIADRAFFRTLDIAVKELQSFFGDIVVRASNAETSSPPYTVPAALVRSGKLTHDQITDMCIFLLFAGHETTANLIANGIHALALHPKELNEFQGTISNPTRLRAGISEMMRYDPPVRILPRYTTGPCQLGPFELPAGHPVAVSIAAANRDPRVFPNPDVFAVNRTSSPNLAFGSEVHKCLGMPLALDIATIAFSTFFKVFSRVAPAWTPETPLEHHDLVLLRQLKELPVYLSRS